MSSGVSADDLFSAAVGVVHNLPLTGPVKITNEEKLAYYGLYKHATEGPCSRPKPGLMDIIEAFKWDAWNRLRETSQNEAKQRYADLTREKIRKANREFKMQDWMGHEDWNRLEPILLPKLRLLVPELVDKYEVARSEVIPSDPEPKRTKIDVRAEVSVIRKVGKAGNVENPTKAGSRKRKSSLAEGSDKTESPKKRKKGL